MLLVFDFLMWSYFIIFSSFFRGRGTSLYIPNGTLLSYTPVKHPGITSPHNNTLVHPGAHLIATNQ